jgi:hypothetical protein
MIMILMMTSISRDDLEDGKGMCLEGVMWMRRIFFSSENEGGINNVK